MGMNPTTEELLHCANRNLEIAETSKQGMALHIKDLRQQLTAANRRIEELEKQLKQINADADHLATIPHCVRGGDGIEIGESSMVCGADAAEQKITTLKQQLVDQCEATRKAEERATGALD